ncbi:MAG: guanylate kinase [Candidatus Omnitrophica bacterium]|nr:guanylate kinase [Candidatus Omnitrophota bacterium]
MVKKPVLSKQVNNIIASKREGILFVVSGPSGCGKTTLCKNLISRRLGLVHSVSATTRAPRKNERANVDYIYMTEIEFAKAVEKKEFLECAKVFDNYYGTPKQFVLEKIKTGQDVILSIDVKGASQIKETFKAAVLVFIMPPTFKDLEKRLSKRASEDTTEIKKRLNIAHAELKSVNKYDYIVINDDIGKATDKLVAVIKTERSRIERRR